MDLMNDSMGIVAPLRLPAATQPQAGSAFGSPVPSVQLKTGEQLRKKRPPPPETEQQKTARLAVGDFPVAPSDPTDDMDVSCLFLSCGCPKSQGCECRFYLQGCGECEGCIAPVPLGETTRPPCEFATGQDRIRIFHCVYAYPRDLFRRPPFDSLTSYKYRRDLVWGFTVVQHLTIEMARERRVFEAEFARLSNIAMMAEDPKTYYTLKGTQGARGAAQGRDEGLFVDVDMHYGPAMQSKQRIRLDVIVPKALAMIRTTQKAMLQLDEATRVINRVVRLIAGFHIVRVARGFLGRRRVRNLLPVRIRELAAMQIQRVFRSWWFRVKIFIPARDKRRLAIKNAAALQVQRVWRGYWARQPFMKLLAARRRWQALCLGAIILGLWRGYDVRRRRRWARAGLSAGEGRKRDHFAALQRLELIMARNRRLLMNTAEGSVATSMSPLTSRGGHGGSIIVSTPGTGSRSGMPGTRTGSRSPTRGLILSPGVALSTREAPAPPPAFVTVRTHDGRQAEVEVYRGNFGQGEYTVEGHARANTADNIFSSFYKIPGPIADRMKQRWWNAPLIVSLRTAKAAFVQLELERALMRGEQTEKDKLPIDVAYPDFPISLEALEERLRRDVGSLADTVARQTTGHALVRSGRQGTGKWSKSGAIGTQNMKRRFEAMTQYYYLPVDPLVNTPAGRGKFADGEPTAGHRRPDGSLPPSVLRTLPNAENYQQQQRPGTSSSLGSLNTISTAAGGGGNNNKRPGTSSSAALSVTAPRFNSRRHLGVGLENNLSAMAGSTVFTMTMAPLAKTGIKTLAMLGVPVDSPQFQVFAHRSAIPALAAIEEIMMEEDLAKKKKERAKRQEEQAKAQAQDKYFIARKKNFKSPTAPSDEAVDEWSLVVPRGGGPRGGRGPSTNDAISRALATRGRGAVAKDADGKVTYISKDIAVARSVASKLTGAGKKYTALPDADEDEYKMVATLANGETSVIGGLDMVPFGSNASKTLSAVSSSPSKLSSKALALDDGLGVEEEYVEKHPLLKGMPEVYTNKGMETDSATVKGIRHALSGLAAMALVEEGTSVAYAKRVARAEARQKRYADVQRWRAQAREEKTKLIKTIRSKSASSPRSGGAGSVDLEESGAEGAEDSGTDGGRSVRSASVGGGGGSRSPSKPGTPGISAAREMVRSNRSSLSENVRTTELARKAIFEVVLKRAPKDDKGQVIELPEGLQPPEVEKPKKKRKSRFEKLMGFPPPPGTAAFKEAEEEIALADANNEPYSDEEEDEEGGQGDDKKSEGQLSLVSSARNSPVNSPSAPSSPRAGSPSSVGGSPNKRNSKGKKRASGQSPLGMMLAISRPQGENDVIESSLTRITKQNKAQLDAANAAAASGKKTPTSGSVSPTPSQRSGSVVSRPSTSHSLVPGSRGGGGGGGGGPASVAGLPRSRPDSPSHDNGVTIVNGAPLDEFGQLRWQEGDPSVSTSQYTTVFDEFGNRSLISVEFSTERSNRKSRLFRQRSARAIAAFNATRDVMDELHGELKDRLEEAHETLEDSDDDEEKQRRKEAAKRWALAQEQAPTEDALINRRPMPDVFYHCTDDPIIKTIKETGISCDRFMFPNEREKVERIKLSLLSFTEPLEEAASLVLAAGMVDAVIDTVASYMQHLLVSTRALNAELAKYKEYTESRERAKREKEAEKMARRARLTAELAARRRATSGAFTATHQTTTTTAGSMGSFSSLGATTTATPGSPFARRVTADGDSSLQSQQGDDRASMSLASAWDVAGQGRPMTAGSSSTAGGSRPGTTGSIGGTFPRKSALDAALSIAAAKALAEGRSRGGSRNYPGSGTGTGTGSGAAISPRRQQQQARGRVPQEEALDGDEVMGGGGYYASPSAARRGRRASAGGSSVGSRSSGAGNSRGSSRLGSPMATSPRRGGGGGMPLTARDALATAGAAATPQQQQQHHHHLNIPALPIKAGGGGDFLPSAAGGGGFGSPGGLGSPGGVNSSNNNGNGVSNRSGSTLLTQTARMALSSSSGAAGGEEDLSSSRMSGTGRSAYS